MKSSKWIIVIVLLLVVGVVVAKQTRSTTEQKAPIATEQVASSTAPTQAPSASVGTSQEKEQAPAEKTVAAPAAEKPEESPQPAAAVVKPVNPPAQVNKPQKKEVEKKQQALGPKPEGPLPGSQLKDCLKNGLPTLADFGMGTCKPCQAMEPILKQAAQDYWGRANVIFVELDKYPELAREYRIKVMPTQVFFNAKGEVIDSHMGFMDRAEMDQRLTALGAKP